MDYVMLNGQECHGGSGSTQCGWRVDTSKNCANCQYQTPMFQVRLMIPDGLTNVTAITSLKTVLVHFIHI
jgi:hypothetical protein